MLAVHPPLNSPYSHSVPGTATSTPLGSTLFQASTPTLNSKVREELKAPSQQTEACAKCLASAATYECRVVRAEGLPVHIGHFRTTNYAVEISIDNDVQRTQHRQHGPDPKWNEILFESFSASNGPTPIAVRIIRVRHLHPEEIVASKTVSIDLRNEVTYGIRPMAWTLKCLGNSHKLVHSTVKIELAFARVAAQTACTHDTSDGHSITETIIDRIEQCLDTEWKELIKAAQTFSQAVVHIAELHPFAALACKLLLYIPDKAVENLERDEQVKALCIVIKDALLVVNESEPLKHLHEGTYAAQVQILAKMTHQITECARFLRTYADEACLWTGMFKHILTAAHVDKHVRHYQEVVQHLLSSFRDNALVQIQIRIHRLANPEDDFVIKQTAVADTYHAHSLLHPEKAHIRHGANRAHEVFDELTHWIEDPKHNAARTFLLISASDDASAVAHEIAWQYSQMGRLASSFTFDAPAGRDGRNTYHSPQALIQSLSRDMANFDAHFKSALRDAVASDPDIVVSEDCSQLFERLVLQPAARVSVVGPVVVIVDKFRLGHTNEERETLTYLLSKQFVKLPSNFRVVLTMEPDNRIDDLSSLVVHKVSL